MASHVLKVTSATLNLLDSPIKLTLTTENKTIKDSIVIVSADHIRSFMLKAKATNIEDLVNIDVNAEYLNNVLIGYKPINYISYTVSWEITLSGSSPLDAAKEAYKAMKDTNSLATYLEVSDKDRETVYEFNMSNYTKTDTY